MKAFLYDWQTLLLACMLGFMVGVLALASGVIALLVMGASFPRVALAVVGIFLVAFTWWIAFSRTRALEGHS